MGESHRHTADLWDGISGQSDTDCSGGTHIFMTVYTIIKLYLNNRIVTLMLPHFCLFCDNIIHARNPGLLFHIATQSQGNLSWSHMVHKKLTM